SSVLAWSAMTAEATGPSLVLATVTVKSWEAVAPALSVAVTRIWSAPTSPLSGVPENVLVAGSKLSQAGRALPSVRVADRVRLSPTSTSLKLLGATVKLKPASSVLAWSAMTAEATGALLLSGVGWITGTGCGSPFSGENCSACGGGVVPS